LFFIVNTRSFQVRDQSGDGRVEGKRQTWGGREKRKIAVILSRFKG